MELLCYFKSDVSNNGNNKTPINQFFFLDTMEPVSNLYLSRVFPQHS